MILLPWGRQPIGQPRLDQSNLITRGIIDCSVGAQYINLASGLRLGINGGTVIHIAASPQGLARVTDGSNFFAASAAPAGLDINEATLMVLTTPRSVGSATRSICGFGNTGSATPLLFVGQGGSAGTLYLFARDGGGTTQNPTVTPPSGTWVDNQPAVIVAARSVGRNVHELYVNGIQAATTTATTLSATSFNSTAIGGLRRNTDGLGYWGSTALAVTWSRCLSPAEILRVSQCPWQIFAPQIIWIDSPASGVSIDCAVGDATATGIQARIESPISIGCSVGNATAAGVTATIVAVSSTVACTPGDAVAAGISASIEGTPTGGSVSSSGGGGGAFRSQRSSEFNRFIKGLFEEPRKKPIKQKLAQIAEDAKSEVKLQMAIASLQAAFDSRQARENSELAFEVEITLRKLQARLAELEEEEGFVVSNLLL